MFAILDEYMTILHVVTIDIVICSIMSWSILVFSNYVFFSDVLKIFNLMFLFGVFLSYCHAVSLK